MAQLLRCVPAVISLVLCVHSVAYAAQSQFIFGPNAPALKASAHHKTLYVAVGSFKNHDNAIRLHQRLKSQYPALARIKSKNGLTHVYLGPVYSAAEAAELTAKVSQKIASKRASHPTIQRVLKPVSAPVEEMESAPTLKPYHAPQPSASVLKRASVYESFRSKWAIQHPVVTLSGGADWYSIHQSELLSLQPQIQKSFVSDSASSAVGNFSGFLGVQRDIRPTLQGQFGLIVGGTTSANVAGEVWEDGDPFFNNLSYGYKINHAYLGLQGKVLKDLSYLQLQPYLSGSVGIGFNHSYGFNNTPLIFEEVAQPNFKSNTTTTFSYTVGTGIQRRMNENFAVGFGYEFSDWGKSALGLAANQTTQTGPRLNHLYTNALLINLSYVPEEMK